MQPNSEPDEQPTESSQLEKALTVNTALQAGANLVTQAAGMQAGLMGVSFPAMVIDNDMLGAILRANVPPEVTAETLALDAIRRVVRGEGHFLGQPETHARMKSDFLYPDLADRRPIRDWESDNTPLEEAAAARVAEILGRPPAAHLDTDLAADLRRRFGLRPLG